MSGHRHHSITQVVSSWVYKNESVTVSMATAFPHPSFGLHSKGAGGQGLGPPKPAPGQARAELSLDKEVEVGARELVVDALEERVGVRGGLEGSGGAGPRAVLRGVGEGEGAGVEEAVGAHQAHGHRDGGAQPAPVAAEGGYVGYHAHQGPGAPGVASRLGLQ